MPRGLQVQIPVTSICTLKCITCIRGTDLKYLPLYQSVDDFKNIIERLGDLKESIRNIDLTCIIGETSQDKDIIKKLEVLENAPHILSYDFVTNLVPHKEVDIVDIITSKKYSKMAPIFVSIYGMDEKSYVDYTKTSLEVWNVFHENLKRLLDKTFDKDARALNLYYRFEQYQESADSVLFSKIKILSRMGKVAVDDSTATSNYDWAGRHPAINNLAPIPKQTGMCLHAVEQNCIWPNGDVSQCGMIDYNKEMIKGNVFKDSLDLFFKNKMHELCKGCREYEMEVD
jgi:uncharacterized Fe-S cluster-containing radical SAM superfamily protein